MTASAAGQAEAFNLSALCIRRPKATALTMLGLALAGLAGYSQLAVSALPQIDYPTLVVATLLPGASAETMVATVTAPLERQLGQVPSLVEMTSVSSFGSSQITLQFALERQIDAAEQDVQAAINAAMSLLPPSLPAPPTYSKSNPADTPILTLAVRSASRPLSGVHDYADSVLAQKISQISGVGLVTLGGGQKPAVRIQVDPEALAGLGLTLEDVRSLVQQANVNQPKGTLNGPRLAYAVATDDQISEAEGYRSLILAYRQGAPVRLREVAQVVDGVENTQLAGWADGERAIILNVQRQPGANVIAVADRIKALLASQRGALPEGLEVDVLADRTETVRASVDDVQFTLALTLALVVAVIYLFLRSGRATLIPGIAVPLSLVGTFGAMHLLGYSLDNLSLMALTIATGFVVDDAIVMVENISRCLEEGDAPLAAALRGSRQIGFTIVSLTVSLVAVLIPLLFMSGLIGRLFREFAVTLGVAIAISALISLTLTPTMCAALLRPPRAGGPRPNALLRASDAAFARLTRAYERGLVAVLAHQGWTLAATLATVALTGALVWWVPKGFFPEQDTGLLLATTEAQAEVSFAHMLTLQQRAAKLLQDDPDVRHVASFVGADGINPTANSGRLTVALTPFAERRASAQEVMARLRPQLSRLEGLAVYLLAVQDLQLDARLSRTQYQIALEGTDEAELRAHAPRVLAALKAMPELTDVSHDAQALGLQVHVGVERDSAARLGVALQTVDDTLYDAFGQRIVSTIFTQLNQYRVILEVLPAYQLNPESLAQLFVRGADGAVPLSTLAHTEQRLGPLALSHQGQFPAVTLSFNLAPRVALGDAVDAVHHKLQALQLPPGVRSGFRGAAAAYQASLASEPWLVAAALFTIYIVLGVLYESYVHPLTILSTLPSAGIGALAALALCGMELNVIAFIGIILLIGIVKKNAIMMIDFALVAERDLGLPPKEAIFQACLLRFRPIMMTTLAALLGGVPLAVGHGAGAELRRPLGVAIVGGLALSQILTLFTTPVIYLWMGRVGRPSRAPRAA